MRNHLSIYFLTVIVGVAVASCTHRESPVSVAGIRAEQSPDQESWLTKFYISENGVPTIHLSAQYMARYEKPDSTYMLLTGTEDGVERVRVDLFDAAGDSSATVFCDRLTYFEREKRFVARGNVIVISTKGDRLESEHLAWSEYDRKIRTPGFVRIVSPDRDIQGYGLEAAEDLTSIQMTRGSGTFTADEN